MFIFGLLTCLLGGVWSKLTYLRRVDNLFASLTYDYLGPFSDTMHLPKGDTLGEIQMAYQLREKNGSYKSELCFNGETYWNTTHADENGAVKLEMPTVDWDSLIGALGIGISSNFHTWAIAEFSIAKEQQFHVSCAGVSKFWIDQTEFMGDIYADRAWWGDNSWLKWPIKLKSGTHTLRVLAKRSFRCSLVLAGDAIFALQAVKPSDFNPGLVDRVPDIVDRRLVSPFVSFPLVNGYHLPTINSADGVTVQARVVDGSATIVSAEILSPKTAFTADPSAWGLAEHIGFYEPVLNVSQRGVVRLLPGQAFPLAISLKMDVQQCLDAKIAVEFTIQSIFVDHTHATTTRKLVFACKSFGKEPYTYTFIDADGSIQYGAVIPPSKSCPPQGCAISFSTHGAGVDAASPTWTKAYDQEEKAWIILATNRGKYGFDWQGVGRRNGLHTLHSFVKDLPGVPQDRQKSFQADSSRILFSGHSMGGHGCLVFSTSFADQAIGAACVAGWIRFDHYVQQFQSIGTSFSDPTLLAVLRNAVAEYHTDLNAANLKGIPFMAKSGMLDAAVHPWNLRRFVRVLDSINREDPDGGLDPSTLDSFTSISEIPGQGHWFGDIMNGNDIKTFFQTRFDNPKPSVPSFFRVTAMNLWGTGRGGVKILQMLSPFVTAWIDIKIVGDTWYLTPQNVRRFSLNATLDTVWINDQQLKVPVDSHYCLESRISSWSICHGDEWQSSERSVLNSGPARQVYAAPSMIIYGTQHLNEIQQQQMIQHARSLANTVLVRGHTATMIYSDIDVMNDFELLMNVNIIVLGGPRLNLLSREFLTESNSSTLTRASEWNQDGSFSIGPDGFSKPNIGGVVFGSFDRLRNGRFKNHLFLMVAGTDFQGFSRAVALVPAYPNAEVPDYMVIEKAYQWKGTGGILSTGFWGNDWEHRPDLSYPR